MNRRRAIARADRVKVRAALRAWVAVGRGRFLGLDTIAGIVHARVQDHGGDAWMPRGQVHLEVWGGEPERIWGEVRRNAMAGIVYTLTVHQARPWHRWHARLRWWWWLVRNRAARAKLRGKVITVTSGGK